MSIYLKIEAALKNELPFVVYRKPNSTILNAFFQKNNTLYTSDAYKESGFLFAPFNSNNPTILLPKDATDFYQEKVDINNNITSNSDSLTNNASKESHISLVSKGINAIENGLFKKVVLSRKENIEASSFNPLTTFKNLLKSYPTAFTYLWFHPKVGMWLGATPETLVKINGSKFTTMSLAGTQTYKDNLDVTWQEKEIEEQQFVTDYITEKLAAICSNISTSKTETIKAGKLLHLRTIITGSLNQTQSANLIKTLHPTPAVCGLPLEPSKDFILNNENYNRSFYTGFLGELNVNKDNESLTELFVNLRCMEVTTNNISVFVGGGITKDSNPEKEWKETVAKTTTMKSVL